jgi:hypothetical protein
MSTTGKAVVNQPRQHTFSRRLVAIAKVLADGALPGAKGLYALFDEIGVRPLVARGAACTLILAER